MHADGSSSVLAVEALALSLGTFCVDGAFGYDNRRASIPFAPLIPDADALFGAVLRLSSRDTCVAYVPEIAHRERGAGVPGGASSGRGAVKLEVSAFLRALITKVQPRHPIDSLDAWAAYVGAALEAVSSSGVPKFLDLAYECAHAEWMAALREVEDLLDSSVPDGAATKRVLSGLRRDLVCALRRPGEVVPRDSRQLRDHIGRLGRLIAAWPGLWAACAALPVEERLARFAAKA